MMQKKMEKLGKMCLGAFALSAVLWQTAFSMQVQAAEGIYISSVAELKADKPEQKLIVEASGVTVSKTMAELAGIPVIIQENADGSRYCNITDTALVDAMIGEINTGLSNAPGLEKAWYYDEKSVSFFQYDIVSCGSINDSGRLKILNELQAGIAGVKSGDIKVTLKEEDLTKTVNNVPEEMAAFLYTVKGSCTTNFKGSSANRCNNIAVAAGNINHMMILPGQEVSINAAFKPRNSANGYKSAGAYSGGKVIEAIGGGICQVSSTVYNAAMNAGLTITERHAHSMPVHYLPLGMDATISSGSKDLKFRNDYAFPVFIETSVQGKDVTVNIYTNALLTAGTSYRLHAVRTGSLSAKAYLEVSVNGVVMEDRYVGASAYKPLIKETEAEED